MYAVHRARDRRHRADVANPTADRVTVGTVQKEIRVGMSGAEVAQILGSPNIVSTDELRREVMPLAGFFRKPPA